MKSRTLDLGFVFALVVTFTMALGCAVKFEDLVKVRTPIPVQESSGLPAKLPLSQARGEYQDWRASQQRADAEWRASIEGGEEFVSLFGGFAMNFITENGGALGAAFPWLAPLLPLGAWGAGKFFSRRPGDLTQTEADLQWNEAVQQTLAAVREGRDAPVRGA